MRCRSWGLGMRISPYTCPDFIFFLQYQILATDEHQIWSQVRFQFAALGHRNVDSCLSSCLSTRVLVQRQSFVKISGRCTCLHSHFCPSSLFRLTFATLTPLLVWTVLHCMLPSPAVQAPFPTCCPLLVLLLHCSPPFLSVLPTFFLDLSFHIKDPPRSLSVYFHTLTF